MVVNGAEGVEQQGSDTTEGTMGCLRRYLGELRGQLLQALELADDQAVEGAARDAVCPTLKLPQTWKKPWPMAFKASVRVFLNVPCSARATVVVARDFVKFDVAGTLSHPQDGAFQLSHDFPSTVDSGTVREWVETTRAKLHELVNDANGLIENHNRDVSLLVTERRQALRRAAELIGELDDLGQLPYHTP